MKRLIIIFIMTLSIVLPFTPVANSISCVSDWPSDIWDAPTPQKVKLQIVVDAGKYAPTKIQTTQDVWYLRFPKLDNSIKSQIDELGSNITIEEKVIGFNPDWSLINNVGTGHPPTIIVENSIQRNIPSGWKPINGINASFLPPYGTEIDSTEWGTITPRGKIQFSWTIRTPGCQARIFVSPLYSNVDYDLPTFGSGELEAFANQLNFQIKENLERQRVSFESRKNFVYSPTADAFGGPYAVADFSDCPAVETASGSLLKSRCTIPYYNQFYGFFYKVGDANMLIEKKSSTLTCIKGKTVKKVTAVKPVCPKGYKKK